MNIRDFISSNPQKVTPRSSLGFEGFHTTLKSGPFGPALMSSVLELGSKQFKLIEPHLKILGGGSLTTSILGVRDFCEQFHLRPKGIKWALNILPIFIKYK